MTSTENKGDGGPLNFNELPSIIDIDGHKATVMQDTESGIFRGEFVDFRGGADFFAADLDELKNEGRRSLQIYLAMCQEKNIKP